MLHQLRLIFLPISWVYGSITWLRNKLYDKNVLSSYEIPVNSICVGNLSMGGTGKTPHVAFFTEYLFNDFSNIAILSRGYGRKTKGLLEVQEDDDASNVGDEPLFYKNKFGCRVKVVVCEDRKNGVEFILDQHPKTDLIILDDAFQHRKVKARTNVLLTDFSHLYSSDFVVPAGNLREFRSGRKRADMVIVTKCPENCSEQEQYKIIRKLKVDKENVLFSRIAYGEIRGFENQELPKATNALVVTGIAKPKPLIEHLSNDYKMEHMRYNDHYAYTPKDIEDISRKFNTFAQQDKIVISTEKDFMRFKKMNIDGIENWFYQSITIEFENQKKLNQLIDQYVRKI